MTLDEVLAGLFPTGHAVRLDGGLLSGSGPLEGGGEIAVLGVADQTPIGVDEALALSRRVLDLLAAGGSGAILVLVDSSSQRMSKRDELLGLNEYLAQLSKCLLVANRQGRRTVGLLYGHTAAGAFIATALSTGVLVALPGAEPAVMDLESMSKVTKLPLVVLREKAKSTPVFAPGLDNLAQTGAVAAIWDPKLSLAGQLRDLLATDPGPGDTRGALGRSRQGRLKAAEIAERVHDLALAAG
jgi:malonate decarboxylase gamma subunit